MHRSISRKVLVTLFALLAVNGFVEALQNVVAADVGPIALFWLQVLAGALAVACAVGLWRRARWAPIALVAWGVETAVMVVLLGPILDLEPEGRGGLWTGAAIVLAIAGLCAWYARRTEPG